MVRPRSIMRLSCPVRRFSSLNKNMKLRGSIFTMEVLVGMMKVVSEPPQYVEAVKTQAPKSPVYDTSSEIEGVSTVQSKYLSKISRKLGGSNPIASAGAGHKGDGDLHAAAKSLLKQESQRAPSRWVLSVGMGGLLDYASSRSIALAVLPISGQTEALRNTLVDQTADITWAHVGACFFEQQQQQKKKNEQQQLHEQIELAATSMTSPKNGNISPKELLLVSSSEAALALAKEKGYLTCRFRQPDGLFSGQVATDFTASSAIELQDCLEFFNGVALRASAFGHRSF